MQIDYRYWAVAIVFGLIAGIRAPTASWKFIAAVGLAGIFFVAFSLLFALRGTYSDTRLLKMLLIEKQMAFDLSVWSRLVAAGYSLILADIVILLRRGFNKHLINI